MHPSLTTSYLLPAIFLNPILFLHSVNTILSRVLPPVIAATAIQPAPYSNLGPSGLYPHLDIHSSEQLCWSYTAVIVCAQLLAFGKVSQSREERREQRKRRKQGKRIERLQGGRKGSRADNGRRTHQNGHVFDTEIFEPPGSSECDIDTTEDEMML